MKPYVIANHRNYVFENSCKLSSYIMLSIKLLFLSISLMWSICGCSVCELGVDHYSSDERAWLSCIWIRLFTTNRVVLKSGVGVLPLLTAWLQHNHNDTGPTLLDCLHFVIISCDCILSTFSRFIVF
jgi:hypothetical protein